MPLGLEARSEKLPWVCIATVVATVLYSVYFFDPLSRYTQTFVKLNYSQEALQASLALAAVACPLDSEQGALVCGEISKLKDSAPRNIIELQSGLTPSLGPKVQAKIAKYVMQEEKWLFQTKLAHLPEWQSYKEHYLAKLNAVKDEQKKFRLVSRANLDLPGLLHSQFIHGGWLHLIGNMLFLLAFGFAVEARVGGIGFSIIYLLGGTFGFFTHLFISDAPLSILLGASASIFALVGAFSLYFYQHKVRVLFSLSLILNRVVMMPALLYIPLFVLLSEFSGVLRAHGQVAHWAHLGGFVAGAAIGYLVECYDPIPKGFALRHEWRLFREFMTAGSPILQAQTLSRLLKINPSNARAIYELKKQFVLHEELSQSDEQKFLEIFRQNANSLLVQPVKIKKLDSVTGLFLKSIPLRSFKGLHPGLFDDLVRIGDSQLQQNQWAEALRTYDAALLIKNSEALKRTVDTIVAHASSHSDFPTLNDQYKADDRALSYSLRRSQSTEGNGYATAV